MRNNYENTMKCNIKARKRKIIISINSMLQSRGTGKGLIQGPPCQS